MFNEVDGASFKVWKTAVQRHKEAKSKEKGLTCHPVRKDRNEQPSEKMIYRA